MIPLDDETMPDDMSEDDSGADATEMDERDLLRILKEEESDSASYFSSEIANDQAEAFDRYLGRPYGDEVEGRSRVVSRDIEDTVNWLLPDLMRVFLSSDDLITVEADNPAEAYNAQCAAGYLGHVFFKDNPGDRIIHDFAFDGLIQRVGILHCTWQDPEPKPPQTITGLNPAQLQKYQTDPEYKILGVQPDTGGQTLTVKVQRTPLVGRVKIEVVPPEEFRFARRASSLDDGEYHGRKRLVFLGDLKRLYPDKAGEIGDRESVASDDRVGSTLDTRRESRFYDEPSPPLREESREMPRAKVYLTEEFIRVDFDGDGVPELRHVKRVGDVILENVEVESTEFFPWSPIRIAHKLVGRSLADVLSDLQRIRTVLMRRALDSLGQSLTPRTVVNTAMAQTSTIDDLIDHVIGSVIEVQGDVREAITALETPDVSAGAFQALEYMDQRVEQASGVTRHSQGIDPDVLNKTASGIALLQSAASARVELISRWMAKGLEPVFRHILRLICRHQDQPRLLKLKGKPLQLDPRTWSDEMSVALHIGIGAESRQQKVANLSVILQKQEGIMAQVGPDNPICGPVEYRAALARLCETIGFKDSSQFFREPPPQQPQGPPPKDPKLVEAEGKVQAAQEELKAKMQMQQAELQAKTQLAAQDQQTKQQLAEQEFGHKTKLAEADRELEQWKAQAKIQAERELAILRMQEEMRIAEMRMNAEMELARWKTTQEMEIKRAALKAGQADNGSNGTGGAEGGGGSYRPGGRLDA